MSDHAARTRCRAGSFHFPGDGFGMDLGLACAPTLQRQAAAAGIARELNGMAPPVANVRDRAGHFLWYSSTPRNASRPAHTQHLVYEAMELTFSRSAGLVAAAPAAPGPRLRRGYARIQDAVSSRHQRSRVRPRPIGAPFERVATSQSLRSCDPQHGNPVFQ